MGLNDFLEHARKEWSENITEWLVIPSKEPQWVDFPPSLAPSLKKALEAKGITRLYSHQSISWEYICKGENVVIVTPTASGKTLCYNLPILQNLINDSSARALYLFPTKALSQDQQAALNDVILGGNLPLPIYTFDGDTPSSVRMSARKGGRIIITNPDMLHTGVLPNHTKWSEFFQNIKYIVLDELHIYTGVFGSHMANLMRRVFRICHFYGSNPTIIASSATIGNPGELAKQLLGKSFVTLDSNGAPAGEKHVVLYNPPLVDPVQGIRRGVVKESQRLALQLLKANVKTIVFTQSRINAELVAGYINESLKNPYNRNKDIRVESYRGGYLPSERREVEKGLRNGSIQGVVSTNALELGIDIGGLDAAVLAGLPSSIASVWQRAGRAGRGGDVSVVLLVGSSNPSNQYLIKQPEYFLDKSPESAYIDPENPYILIDHIKCAVFELPFEDGEEFSGNPKDILALLEEQGTIRYSSGRWYWSDRSYPSERISLRGGGEGNIVIVDTSGGANRIIGEMDTHSARELLHNEAIYLHRGEQFVVKHLDFENHHAYVETAKVNYYTDAIKKSDIKVLSEDRIQAICGVEEHLGDLLVRTEVAKYKKIRFGTHENIGYGDIHLPEEEMHTRGTFLAFADGTGSGDAWKLVPDELRALVLSNVASLIRVVAPIFLLSRVSDIGVAARVIEPHYSVSGFYVYDNYPGGIGLAESLALHIENIAQAALELVKECQCEEGCPSCVGARDERDMFPCNPKSATLDFLRAWIV